MHPPFSSRCFAPAAPGWHKRFVRILYHLPLSPYSRKVRLALAEKRIPFDLRVERVWERREEFLTINPACTVPVLQEENGFCIIDSYAICEYLDEAYPDMPLLGRSLGERAEIRRLWPGLMGNSTRKSGGICCSRSR